MLWSPESTTFLDSLAWAKILILSLLFNLQKLTNAIQIPVTATLTVQTSLLTFCAPANLVLLVNNVKPTLTTVRTNLVLITAPAMTWLTITPAHADRDTRDLIVKMMLMSARHPLVPIMLRAAIIQEDTTVNADRGSPESCAKQM